MTRFERRGFDAMSPLAADGSLHDFVSGRKPNRRGHEFRTYGIHDRFR